MPRSSVLTVRIPPQLRRTLTEAARRAGRSTGSLAAELLDLGLRSRRYPGITFVEGPTGIRAHLAGTGLDVWEAVWLLRSYGSEERLLEAFPHLTRRALRIASSYASEFPEEIEERIRAAEAPEHQFATVHPDPRGARPADA